MVKKILAKSACLLCVAFLAVLMIVPAFVPANALGDGRSEYYPLFPLEMSWQAVNADSNTNYVWSVPLFTGSGAVPVNQYFSADVDQNGVTEVVASFLDPSWTTNATGRWLEYEVYIPDSANWVRFDWTGLAVLPTSGLGDLGSYWFRFNNECMVSIEMEYYEIVPTYIGAATKVGQSAVLKTYSNSISYDPTVNGEIGIPVVSSDNVCVVTSVNITVLSSTSKTTFMQVRQRFMSAADLNSWNTPAISAYNFMCDVADPGDVIGVDFTSWLTSAVGGFMDFEFIPGLSIGGIVAGILGLGLLIAILMYFAGG